MYSTLISPEQLAATLADVIVIDCRFDLANAEAGRRAYAEAHIPGARYAHLDEDLSGPKSPTTGRHPLPEPHVLAATFGRLGIANGAQVIAYDADNGMFASRLWWLMRWVGERSVAVLDGGFKAWREAGLPTTAAAPTWTPTRFEAHVDDRNVLDTAAIERLANDPSWCLLDARAPERFRGDVEPIDPVAGHIPGARNHPFAWNLGSNGRWLKPDELKTKLMQSLGGTPSERGIMMCGSGVTACHNLLALEIARLPGAKLYAGSWSEWIRNPSRPVAKGS